MLLTAMITIMHKTQEKSIVVNISTILTVYFNEDYFMKKFAPNQELHSPNLLIAYTTSLGMK